MTEAKDWGKAFILAAFAYVLFLLPNSSEMQQILEYALLQTPPPADTPFIAGLIQLGAIVSALATFVSALWE